MKMGKVWLVGAGPSDAGLLTLKGKAVLERAELIVYDRLVGAEILSMLPPEAKQIDVGKRAGSHTLPQEEINRLLLREARNGRQVVRLKGGDPFVFGRGGEEACFLQKHGVEFEIVPGVTSAVSVPAYAGIPVTHRGAASAVYVATAHREAGVLSLDFPVLAALGAETTLVFLMGIGVLREIAEGLIAAGMPPETPAAVVENGTNSRQQKRVTTLAALPDTAQSAAIGTPGIMIVGRVCSLSEALSWAEKRPLHGLRVLLTRPAGRRASQTAASFREEGAEVVELPAIRTEPVASAEQAAPVLREIGACQWLAFTSKTGVDVFFEAMLSRGLDMRALAGVKLAAVGPATARALRERGLIADYVPETACGASLGEGLAVRAAGERVLLVTPELPDPDCAVALRRAGVAHACFPVYRTRLTVSLPSWFSLQDGDLAVFTSASSVRGFFQCLPHAAGIDGLCIGKKTAEEAARYGVRCIIAEQASIPGLLAAARKYNQGRKTGTWI